MDEPWAKRLLGCAPWRQFAACRSADPELFFPVTARGGRRKSQGDLRRLLEREGGAALSRSAGEAMNANPRTIASEEFAATALAILEQRKITSLVVVDAEQTVEGVLHLHDLWGVELI